MKQIPLANNKGIALVDDEDYDAVAQHSWCNNGYGYAIAQIRGKSVRMHRWLLGAGDGQEIDHVNRNKSDNRRSNLRFCTHAENMMNRAEVETGIPSNSTTGLKGVSWRESHGKYSATLWDNGKAVHIGYFSTAEQASRTYKRVSRILKGE